MPVILAKAPAGSEQSSMSGPLASLQNVAQQPGGGGQLQQALMQYMKGLPNGGGAQPGALGTDNSLGPQGIPGTAGPQSALTQGASGALSPAASQSAGSLSSPGSGGMLDSLVSMFGSLLSS
jgi:hypothetical protein